jgi:hypothetical protein
LKLHVHVLFTTSSSTGLPRKSRSARVVRDSSLPMPIVNNVERGEGLTVDLVAILLAASTWQLRCCRRSSRFARRVKPW